MLETAKISFYRVNRCGYYNHDKNAPQFCDLAAMLPDLATWVRHGNKPLEDTCTFTVPEDSDLLPVYCHNIRHNQGHDDYLVTTWNATPAVDGQTPSVSAKRPVGQARVYLNSVRADTIAGFPTYFWLIPTRNLLATVRFDYPQNGQTGLCLFLRSFLQKCSSHVHIDPDWDGRGEVPILGYCAQPGTNPTTLRPQFKTSLYRRSGVFETIRRKRPAIRKLLRKNRLNVGKQNDADLWQRMLRGAHLSAPPAARNDVKVKYELEFTPSEAQLDSIISNWERDHELDWDDVGFAIKGEPAPLWLSHVFAKTEIEVDVRRLNSAIIADDTLMAALQAKRPHLLDLVPE